MKILKIVLFALTGISISSCMRSSYQVNGKGGILPAEKLKSYAFANPQPEGANEKWNSLHLAVYKDLAAKNYFYDNVNPEVLVFVEELPGGVELLSGATYTEYGVQKLESGKVKTRGKTLLIQLVETEHYKTIWRGFAASRPDRLAMILQPKVAESILNQ